MRPSDRALRRRRGGHRADDIGTAIIACSTSASRGLRGSRVLRVLELAHLPLPLPLPLPFDHVNAFACTFYVNKARTHGPDKRVSWMEESGGDTGRVLVSLGERSGGRGRHRVTKFQYHRHRHLQLFYICVYIYVSVSCSQAGIDRAEQVLSSLLMGENQFDSRREIVETRRKK